MVQNETPIVAASTARDVRSGKPAGGPRTVHPISVQIIFATLRRRGPAAISSTTTQEYQVVRTPYWMVHIVCLSTTIVTW